MSEKLLTIGMATYDDFDGVFFSIQALRMYQLQGLEDNVEIIDEKPLEIEKETTEENSVKPESSTTIYLKNLMLIEEKMFNILEVRIISTIES